MFRYSELEHVGQTTRINSDANIQRNGVSEMKVSRRNGQIRPTKAWIPSPGSESSAPASLHRTTEGATIPLAMPAQPTASKHELS